MTSHFSCPKCGTKYSAQLEQVGKKGRCKNCGSEIVVPEIATQSATSKKVEKTQSFTQITCPKCHGEIDISVKFCPNCGYNLKDDVTKGPKDKKPQKTTVFQAIALISFFVGLFTPRIFLFFPTMLVLVCTVISLIRKEPRWGLSIIVGGLGMFLFFAPYFDSIDVKSSSNKAPNQKRETRTLAPSSDTDIRPTQPKAEILYIDYVWSTRTTHDKVANVSGEVKNNLDRPIEVIANVVARNSQGRLVDSKQVYVPMVGQIPPKSTGSLKTHFYNDGRGITKVEASIAKVYVK